MRKILNFIVNSISWLMIVAMFVYMIDVIFNLPSVFLDKLFEMANCKMKLATLRE